MKRGLSKRLSELEQHQREFNAAVDKLRLLDSEDEAIRISAALAIQDYVKRKVPHISAPNTTMLSDLTDEELDAILADD